MTSEQMIAMARDISAGKSYKKADVVEFMRAIVAQVEADEGADGPCPVVIDRTPSGVHLPPNANRSYTFREARALGRALQRAAE